MAGTVTVVFENNKGGWKDRQYVYATSEDYTVGEILRAKTKFGEPKVKVVGIGNGMSAPSTVLEVIEKLGTEE